MEVRELCLRGGSCSTLCQPRGGRCSLAYTNGGRAVESTVDSNEM